MNKKKITLEYSVYNDDIKNIEDYSDENRYNNTDMPYPKLCKEAIKISDNAYSLYSGFSVGAAVLLEDDTIILGSNQENIAFPSGICAERTALSYAATTHPKTPVKALAIAAKQRGKLLQNPVSPCGSCRQVFAETITRFKKDFDIIMIGQDKTIIIKAGALLPLAFEF